MTHEEVKALVEEMGLPYAYDHFAEGESPNPPFICFLYAQAEANRKLAESLSDTLIDYQKIQKWDGKLPTVSGGNALVSIDPAE